VKKEKTKTNVPSNAALSEVSDLVAQLIAVEDEVAIAENELSAKKEQLRLLSEERVPVAMDELGLEKVTLTSGEQVAVKRQLRASIPKARLAEGLAWLRGNGHDDIIKNQVIAEFGRGEDARATELLENLRRGEYVATAKMTVNHQTLGATVRELTEEGVEVPHDILGVYEAVQTKITRKR